VRQHLVAMRDVIVCCAWWYLYILSPALSTKSKHTQNPQVALWWKLSLFSRLWFILQTITSLHYSLLLMLTLIGKFSNNYYSYYYFLSPVCAICMCLFWILEKVFKFLIFFYCIKLGENGLEKLFTLIKEAKSMLSNQQDHKKLVLRSTRRCLN
jgi:hypothetical protein